MKKYYTYALQEFEKEMNKANESIALTIWDQIEIIEYYMQLIKNDLATSAKIQTLYTNILEVYSVQYYDMLFPNDYVKVQDNTEKFMLGSDTYVSMWDLSRFNRVVSKIKKNNFKEDKNNHWSYYYKELDWLHVYNGKHSATLGSLHDNSYVTAEIVSISSMFGKVFTNGGQWYITNNGSDMYLEDPVIDFRVALLFELSYRKYQLENTI